MSVIPLVGALTNPIQEVDPAQYAEVARRIHDSGDWRHLFDAFGPFALKPPAAMWAMAATMKLLGPTSLAARLPSLLAGLLLLAVTARIGTVLWSLRTGLLGAVLLGSSLAFQLMIVDPKVDAYVTCAMTAAVWLALEARARPRLMWLAWLAIALGVLSKGPIGLALPAVAVLPEALRRRWGSPAEAPQVGLFRRLWALQPLGGLLLVGLLLVPWLEGSYAQHGADGPLLQLWGISFGRLFHQGYYSNPATPAFFLHTALWAFLPFSPMLVWELGTNAVALWKRRLLPPDERRVVWWWLLLPFVAISLAEGKLPQYLYWLAPPAALLCARSFVRRWEEGHGIEQLARYTSRFAVVLWGLTLAVAAGCFAWFLPVKWGTAAAWLLGLALFSGLVALAARRFEGPTRAIAHLALFALSLNALFANYVHPRLLQYQPAEAYGALARREDPTGRVLPFVGVPPSNAAAFYSARDVAEVGPDQVSTWVAEGRTRLAVVAEGEVANLEAHGLSVEPLGTFPYFWTSRPTRAFLDPRTRDAAAAKSVVVRLAQVPRATAGQ